MARARYNIQDKYLATFTMRADGSSVFGENNKFGYFPSGSLMWRLSQEDFLKDKNWLSDLKLRASYGAVGNQAVSPYNSLGVTVLYQGILMNNAGSPSITSGFLPASSLYNPNLKWETSLSANLGLDFSLLADRVSGSFEYYSTRTTDLLVSKSLPNILGYTSQLVNLGEVKNSGVEAMINIRPLQHKEIDWNIGLVFSRNVNKLVKIDGRTDEDGKPVNDLNNNWFIGKSVNVYFDHRFDGIWQTADKDFMDAHPTLNARAGDVRVADLNGDYVINEDDKIIYRRDPKFIASINSSFRFKGFDLYWDLYWVNGVYKQNPYLFSSNQGGALTGLTNGLKVDYWTPEHPSNTAPRPRETGMENPYLHVIGYQDASYVRFRNITLGYTLPARLTKAARIQSVRVYGGLENFFTFTGYQSYSPESNPGDFPEPRVFQFGLNIKL
jgi:TonB-linked SusC/RagA family outer membrane protein